MMFQPLKIAIKRFINVYSCYPTAFSTVGASIEDNFDQLVRACWDDITIYDRIVLQACFSSVDLMRLYTDLRLRKVVEIPHCYIQSCAISKETFEERPTTAIVSNCCSSLYLMLFVAGNVAKRDQSITM